MHNINPERYNYVSLNYFKPIHLPHFTGNNNKDSTLETIISRNQETIQEKIKKKK